MANIDNNYLDVIKFVGDNNHIVTKATIENFNTKTQLIVNESQEALFYKDGQALDLFKSGRHSLTTDNLPFFKKLFSGIFNKQTPFTCEIFFINKVSVLDIQWGTATPINLEDPKYGLLIGVRAFGTTGIRVIDSRKFVVKVVGQVKDFTIENVKASIKGMMLAHVKDIIAKTITQSKVSILDVNNQILELSAKMQESLNQALYDLGLEADKFYIGSISCNDADLKVLKETREKELAMESEIRLAAKREIELGKAKAISREAQGFTYQEERKFDVLEGAAKNEGAAGTIMGAGLGLGMGVGLGGGIGGAMNNASQVLNEKPANEFAICPSCKAQVKKGAKFCSECGSPMPTKKFCSECGAQLDPNAKFCPECGTKQ